MILLASTSDAMSIVTSDAADIDVHAVWIDRTTAGVVTPGRKNTNTLVATSKTIVQAPAASTYRTIKGVWIRNKHATSWCRVTVRHFDGSHTAELFSAGLAPGMTMSYEEQRGWYVNAQNGLKFTTQEQDFASKTIGDLYTQVLDVDVVAVFAVANTLTDVEALSFPVIVGETYYFRYQLVYQSSATANGSRWAIYGPGGATIRTHAEYSLTSTSKTSIEGTIAYDIPAASNATSPTGLNGFAFIEGFLSPTNDGLVFLRFASELASTDQVTLFKGSTLHWQRVL